MQLAIDGNDDGADGDGDYDGDNDDDDDDDDGTHSGGDDGDDDDGDPFSPWMYTPMLHSIQSAQPALTEEIAASLSGVAISISSPSSWAESAVSRRLALPASFQTVLPPALEQGRGFRA